MEAIIKKWGNSPALRLSASLMKEAQLALDQKVTVKVLRGKIIIEPATRKEYKLEELVAGITSANAHEQSDFGKPVGVRPGRLRLLLGATQPGCGDHVHRLGDLPDVFDAFNAASDVSQARHREWLVVSSEWERLTRPQTFLSVCAGN